MNGLGTLKAASTVIGATAGVGDVDVIPGTRSGRRLTDDLLRGGIAALAVYVAGAGVTYCLQLVIARTIGGHGYGIYAYVLAWVTVLANVSALGFDISLLRFVPAYSATRASSLLRGVILYSRRRIAVAGCCVSIAGAGVILWRSTALPDGLLSTFLAGLAMVPILALVWSSAAVARGFGSVIAALAPDRVVRDALVLVFIFATWGAGFRIDAAWTMTATLFSSLAGLGLVSLAVRRSSPDAIRAVAPVYDLPTWRGAALPLMVIETADVLMNRIGVMLLGWMTDTRQAGVYALAFNLAFATMLPRTAVNALLAPAISDLFVRNDQAGLRAIVFKSALWTLIGGGCVALPLLLFGGPILSLFGRDFAAGLPALRILLVGQIIVAAVGSPLHLMNMTGYERSAARLLAAGVVANIAVGVLLVGSLGPTGAAVAATFAVIGWNAAMGFSIRRNLGFWPGVMATWKRHCSRSK